MSNLEAQISSDVKLDRHLAAESAETALDEYFTCMICLMVVDLAEECLSCNQLCCGSCIKGWQDKGNDTCPGCRG